VLAAALALSALHLSLALACLPPFDGDSIAYMPPILNHALGAGLRNPFFVGHLANDPTGEARFVYHGFLYQVVAAALLPRPTPGALHLLNGLANAATTLLVGAVAWRHARCGGGRGEALRVALVVGAMGSTSAIANGLNGRPEPFVMLACAVASACLRGPRRALALGLGLLGGVVAVSDPACGILLGAFVLAYALVRFPRPLAASLLLQSLGVAAVTAACCLALLYPHGVRDWIEGLVRASRWTYGTTNLFSPQAVWWFWVVGGPAPLLFAVLLAALGALLVLLVEHRALLRRRPGAVVGLALAAAAVFLLAMRRHNQNYYLAALLPIGLPWLYAAARRLRRREFHGRVLAAWGIAVLLLLASLPFLRRGALLVPYLESGVSLREAQRRIGSILAREPGRLAVDRIFWVVEPAGLRLYDFNPGEFPVEPAREGGRFVILQQANRGLREPPALPGFRLVEDGFVRGRPRLFGVPLGNVTPGYQMAIYESMSGPVRAPIIVAREATARSVLPTAPGRRSFGTGRELERPRSETAVRE
jgi:hypothetical protein